MHILALDAALARCSVALVANGETVSSRAEIASRGQQSILAAMAEAVLRSLPSGAQIGAVAVTIGPGSFTGLRSAIALAHGLAAGICPVIGVTVAEALAAEIGPTRGRSLWTAIDNRRGRVFLDIDGHLQAFQLADLPSPKGPVSIAGDAAIPVAARWAELGYDVLLTGARMPHAAWVAKSALQRLRGTLPARAAMPIYVDAPEAKLPAGGLRPHPVG